MNVRTPRLGLPQLVTAQAQKELTHNEALACVDALLHAAIDGVAAAPPAVSAPDAGRTWLIGPAATGVFSGRENWLAYWTGGSWRFVEPRDGMHVWHINDKELYRFAAGAWQAPIAVANPSGGTSVDSECRAAVTAIIVQLERAGLLRAV